jgi:hypothetical protein
MEEKGRNREELHLPRWRRTNSSPSLGGGDRLEVKPRWERSTTGDKAWAGEEQGHRWRSLS